ncbi:hypothetical protein [Streptomyces sp. NPDC055642]
MIWARRSVGRLVTWYGRHGIASCTLALLALAGCGSRSDEGSEEPTVAPAPTEAVVEDKGPVCAGEAPQGGVHVLRGGGFQLPGGAGVQYAEARAYGTTREATLREGVRYHSGQRQWKLGPGAQVTVSGHTYTVRQICSYRVVLEPRTAEDRTALAAPPKSMESAGSPADASLCFTTNQDVLAAAAAGFPAKGKFLALVANGGVQRFPTGLSLTVSYVDTGTGTAGIAANCAAVQVAAYENVHVGDPVEFAGVLFKVSALTEESVRLTRTSS